MSDVILWFGGGYDQLEDSQEKLKVVSGVLPVPKVFSHLLCISTHIFLFVKVAHPPLLVPFVSFSIHRGQKERNECT